MARFTSTTVVLILFLLSSLFALQECISNGDVMGKEKENEVAEVRGETTKGKKIHIIPCTKSSRCEDPPTNQNQNSIEAAAINPKEKDSYYCSCCLTTGICYTDHDTCVSLCPAKPPSAP